MWIHRYFENTDLDILKEGKVLVIYGPRRVGKTSLVNKMLDSHQGMIYRGSGEDLLVSNLLSSRNTQRIVSSFDGYDVVFIDEAQMIPDAGLGLKMLIDNLPRLKIIATGSSSFDLSNKLGEPLTGRQLMKTLFPISMIEIAEQFGRMKINHSLNSYLVFGTYPEVLTSQNNNQKIEYLTTLRDAYLLKDILQLENIRNPSKLVDLLRLLAYQIGNEVSLNELSISIGMAKQTVERYLDLLEKVFIIKKVQGFSRNLRKEISKNHRYYFWDNGIRNSLINNFNDISLRDDKGMLWENFIFIERIKKQSYFQLYANNYFWRTYDKKEIDFVEEKEGVLAGYEFKWGKKTTKPPRLWYETYKKSTFNVISPDNYLDFIL